MAAPLDNPAAGNPLLEPFTLPHGAPPFDKIQTAHFRPAFDVALKAARADIAAIKNNPAAPTFENTIEAIEFSGELLGRVQRVFSVIALTSGNDELRAIRSDVNALGAEFESEMLLDAALFARVKAVYDQKDALKLTTEQAVLLEETYREFIDNGALLNAAQKKRMGEISTRLSALSTQFEDNTIKAAGEWQKVIDNEAELAGLPVRAKNSYRAAAEKAGFAGKWLIKLVPPPTDIFQYSTNRALREEVMRASNSISWGGAYSNTDIVMEIVRLRDEQAKIMGYPTFAAYQLADKMAKTPEAVNEMLEENLAVYRPAAEEFVQKVRDYAKKTDGLDKLESWDYSYYSRKLKEETFDLDIESTRPYFDLEKVLEGMQKHAEKLLNITLTEAGDKYPVFNTDVKVYEVHDNADGRLVGIFYADYYARSDAKSDGAWADQIRNRGIEGGVNQIPIIYNACNFDKPTKEQPTLLSLDEVTTAFHEFGHALHALLAEGNYPSLTGTNVKHDFVEAPSQIQENWAKQKEVLDAFAVHHVTGEKIPAALIKKINDMDNFDAAYAGLRQTFFGLLDMKWHTTDPATITSPEALEDSVVARAALFPRTAGPMSTHFGHLFAGEYAAGYYGYKWSERLEADMFTAFAKNGLYDRATGDKFRREVLSKGGTRDPMELFVNFMGRRPDPKALFRREGLLPDETAAPKAGNKPSGPRP